MTTSLINHERAKLQASSLELKGIGKKFNTPKGKLGEFWALENISLEVSRGEILGIIGRNGAGKTTLLSIIAKTLTPTVGKIGLKGKVLGLFHLGVGFQDELTGRENIFLNGTIIGVRKKELRRKQEAIISFSELGNFIDMPLGTYSQGMRLRLAFSIVTNLDFDIFVIDEVLAVGDISFQERCFQRIKGLKQEEKTLIITTQNPELVLKLCDRAILLNHGRLVFCGSPPEAVERYQELLHSEEFFVGPAIPSRGP